MKTIGLLGGMSWESTLTYYQIINMVTAQTLGGLHSARCLLYSVDFDEIERCQQAGDWDRSARILADAAQALERGGADFLVICTNTMHKVATQIAAAVERGDFDAGVLIHEGRFVYRQRQLELVADLGQLWEQRTALPLPLGGIAARRSLPDEVRHEAERLLRTSIEYAFTHPEASRTYIKQHAQELDDKVIDAHIALFVNGYSLSLGDEGRRAVEALTGVIP